jgi:hypothetical protein
MKKGILFDLINNNNIENICLQDEYQFYDLSNINIDIEYCVLNNISLLNLFSEPVQVKDMIDNCFAGCNIEEDVINYNNKTIKLVKRIPKKYDICTKYTNSQYIYDKSQSLTNIINFLNNNKIILAVPLYKIKQHMIENNNNGTLFEIYTQMYNIAIDSYSKYNSNKFEIRKLTSEHDYDDYGDMFKDIVKKLLEIHFIEKRDVLYAESDTICVGNINLSNLNKLLMLKATSGINHENKVFAKHAVCNKCGSVRQRRMGGLMF